MQHMSPEHVEAMNRILREADEVKRACRGLSAPRSWSYHLTEGPDGTPVDWGVRFGDTVEFSLTRPDAPDVVFTADWARMMRASKASREGRTEDAGVEVSGDAAVLAETSKVLEVARGVATLPVDFPDC